MKYKTSVFIWTPFLLAVMSAHFKSIGLVAATVILMFIIVAILPFTHKRENLWLFILWAVCSIPINSFLLNEYPQWRYLLFNGDSGVFNILSMTEMILICTSIEEVVIALVGRKIWKKQYVLELPEIEKKSISLE